MAEVERFMAWPGQALSYKLGMLSIQEMRRQAQNALGARFELRQFHHLITTGGPMTMPRLQKRIDNWIEAQLANR